MSLDVYLITKKFVSYDMVTFTEEEEELYSDNITHNLNKMAEAVGIYKYLWRPDEIGVTKASQLIEPLTIGLKKLREDQLYLETFNPSNGYGNYYQLVEFVRLYLNACKEFPNAEVKTWR
jgi:hypothetical protein